MTKKESVIVSACLTGKKCRYDGGDSMSTEATGMLLGKEAVPLCPEELGGLPTPRPRAEIQGGDGEDVLDGKARVIDELKTDLTDAFIRGAKEAVRRAKESGATSAILKERSPSCGVERIYSGGELTKGMGVTTAALVRAGVTVAGVE